MSGNGQKCVLVIDGALPAGVAANTAAILGITLGKRFPEIVGPDVADAAGRIHAGITGSPIPILKGDRALLRDLRERLFTEEFSGLLAVDFSDVAQRCRVYDEYVSGAAAAFPEEFSYYGLAIYGDAKKVSRLTGSLPLLR